MRTGYKTSSEKTIIKEMENIGKSVDSDVLEGFDQKRLHHLLQEALQEGVWTSA